MQCKNNLREIALALRNYHAAHGYYPPAVTYDAEGRPAHSWRVFILPELDEYELYRQYRFNEPWNSPHNSELAKQIPRVFRCPGYEHSHEHQGLDSPHLKVLTNYVAIVAPDGVLGDEPVPETDITDGTERTILLAETRQHAVNWMQPDDVSPAEILAELRNSEGEAHANHSGGLHFAFADGRAQFIAARIEKELFLSLITRNGNEDVSGGY